MFLDLGSFNILSVLDMLRCVLNIIFCMDFRGGGGWMDVNEYS